LDKATASLFDLKIGPLVWPILKDHPVRGCSLALANLIHEFMTERRFGVHHEAKVFYRAIWKAVRGVKD
jgi:hypothetical protein